MSAIERHPVARNYGLCRETQRHTQVPRLHLGQEFRVGVGGVRTACGRIQGGRLLNGPCAQSIREQESRRAEDRDDGETVGTPAHRSSLTELRKPIR